MTHDKLMIVRNRLARITLFGGQHPAKTAAVDLG
jgi:hypothetical protein